MSYPVYDLRTGARATPYTRTNLTDREFAHLLAWINSRGFHVYGNLAYGGVHRTAHAARSWHYMRSANGISLAADVGTYGDVDERNQIINNLIPHLERAGIAYQYAKDGHVPNHWDHIHIDAGTFGRRGGSAASGYGQFYTSKKVNIFTHFPLIQPLKPKRMWVGRGAPRDITRLVQATVGAKVDGIWGTETASKIKAKQREVGTTPDGIWGAQTARAYFAKVGIRKKGHTGHTVRLLQHIGGVTVDGKFGNDTENVVKRMQVWGGVTPDGVVGPNTRNKILYQ